MKPLTETTDPELLLLLRRAHLNLPDAPQAWQAAAVALMPVASVGSVVAAAIRLVTAVLSFDSWALPVSAMGVRSTGAASRHLLFTADDRDVDLRVNHQDGAYELAGQILGPDETGTVELSPVDSALGPVRTATLDELGSFRFQGLGKGSWRMRLNVGGVVIELPAVNLDERGD